MADDRKDLPPITAPNFLERVREVLSVYLGNRGDVLNRGVTLRDMVEGGMATLNGRWGANGSGSPLVPSWPPVDPANEPYVIDLTPPPTPTGFSASAAIINLFVECDPQTYTQGHGHAKSILYGATDTGGPLPTFDYVDEATASRVRVLTEFQGSVFSYATNPATTWHLWLKWQSVDGVQSVTPAGGTNGVRVVTGQDVALLLAALAGKITTSELFGTLNSRINLIDGDGVGSVVQRLADASSTLTSEYQGADATTLNSAKSYVGSFTYSKSDINGAITVAANSLTSEYQGADATTLNSAKSYVNGYAYSKSSMDGTLSEQASFLRSYSNLGSKTFRQASAPTKRGVDPETSADVALQTGDLWLDTDDANKQYQWNGSAWVYSPDGAIAAVDARVTDVSTTKIGYATKDGKVFDGNGSAIVYPESTYPTENYPAYALNRTLIIDKNGVNGWNALYPSTPAVWCVGLPLARAVKQVSIMVNGVPGTIEDRMVAVAQTANSAYLEKSVRFGSEGSVVGYGLSATIDATSGAVTPGVTDSKFIINVDTFAATIPVSSTTIWQPNTDYAINAIVRHATGYNLQYLQCVRPGRSGSSDVALWGYQYGVQLSDNTAIWQTVSRVPFSVSTTGAVVDGVTVPSGAFMDGAYIRHATITSASIRDLQADKITAGDVTVALNLTAGNTVTGSIKSSNYGVYGGVSQPTWKINGDGSAIFNNITARGYIDALAGRIGGNTIDATGMESPGYVAGTTGWRLDSDGTIHAKSGVFSGNITGATGTFSGSLSGADITGANGTFSGTLAANTVRAENIVADGISKPLSYYAYPQLMDAVDLNYIASDNVMRNYFTVGPINVEPSSDVSGFLSCVGSYFVSGSYAYLTIACVVTEYTGASGTGTATTRLTSYSTDLCDSTPGLDKQKRAFVLVPFYLQLSSTAMSVTVALNLRAGSASQNMIISNLSSIANVLQR